MLTYVLSDKDSGPLYDQLYQAIRNDIETGELKVNEKLPSKRTLAQHLAVSVTTVEKSYEQLLSEGFIYSKPSSGYYVSQISKEPSPSPHSSSSWKSADETEYDMDFRGNDSGLRLFPITVWTKLMRQVLSEANLEMLRTVPWNGLYALRKAICDYLKAYRGIETSPDLIIIGAGTEYLYSRLLNLVGYDAVLGFEDPGYRKLPQIAEKKGLPLQFIPVDKEGMRVDCLYKTPTNIVHLSPANHFPSGAIMPEERRRELIAWTAEQTHRYIVEDDYDSEFSYVRQRHPSLYSLDTNERIIYINTFSKSLVPSLRISYMVLPPSLYYLYQSSQDFYSCTVSSFEQLALAHFIEDGYFERHINKLRTYYKKKRNMFADAILDSSLASIASVTPNSAGTHMLIPIKTKSTDQEIKQRAEQLHLRMQLLSDYCHVPSLQTMKTLVVNYAGMNEEDVEQAVCYLEELFESDLKSQD